MKVGLGACDEISRIYVTWTKSHQNLGSTVLLCVVWAVWLPSEYWLEGGKYWCGQSREEAFLRRRWHEKKKKEEDDTMQVMAVKVKKVLGPQRICNKIQTNEWNGQLIYKFLSTVSHSTMQRYLRLLSCTNICCAHINKTLHKDLLKP